VGCSDVKCLGLKLYLHQNTSFLQQEIELPEMSPTDETLKAQGEEKTEHSVEKEDFGVFSEVFSAKTAIEGQDGGIVSTLLIKGLREGLFDAAIVVERTKGYRAEAIVAQKEEEVLAAKGTKYLRVNVTKQLRELISQGKKRIAIVCTPCEAGVARKIQQTHGENCEITIIGLFCYEAFNHDKLKDKVQARLGVDLDKVSKVQVRQGKLIIEVKGREASCNVKDLHGASEATCGFCDDFASRVADISVGSVGSMPGYSTVIVRSKVGERLVRGLKIDKATVDRQEITKSSKFKKQRAKDRLSKLK
jgi:coenzyme F420 hydrogenase subunit beta